MLVAFHGRHLAALDVNDPVGHGGEGGVVGDDHHGHALLPAGVLKELQNLLARHIVQGARGLVAEEELGVLGQGPGNGHPLLLAARELGREVAQPLPQAHVPQDLLGGEGILADLGGQLHILQGGQVLHQIVELEHKPDVVPAVKGELLLVVAVDALPVHQNGALVAGVHAPQNVEYRGLSCARGAHDDAELSLFDLKGDVAHRVDDHLAHLVTLHHVLQRYIGHGNSSSCRLCGLTDKC